ncbi:MAG TPA: methyl-accepting chemotaxis protein, partial [Candidatus Methanoperedens sp.]|nr:methyl-accepting chemotaxis protein [Candidatus Methanoperedens sp.]
VLGRLEASATESRTAVRDQVGQIASVNEQISRLQDRGSASAGAMDRAGVALQRTSAATGDLTRALEEAAASMTEMDATLREIDRGLRESASLSESVATAAGAGDRAVASTRAGMDRIRESAATAAAAIAELDRQVGRIGTITAVIDDVTEQTGLLALNAAIIAAQAGEHGRGFAVVAGEIRALATRTATSTREINAIVGALREHADASLASMGQSRAQVEEGVTLSNRAAEALSSIQESAGNSLQRVRAISRSIGEIAATSHALSGSVDAIATRAREIAAATASQDQEVAALRGMVQADVEATAAIAAVTREQQHSAHRLEQQADKVAGLVVSSSEALRAGRGQTDMLAATIETLQALDAREREHFGRCETDAERLTTKAQALRQEIERLKPGGEVG